MPTVPYTKQTWTDGVHAASGARLTVLENGIYDVSLAPAVCAYHNTTQSISSGSLTAAALNSERFDTASGASDTQHDTVTNNSRLTCRYAGKYQITGNVSWATSASGNYRQAKLRVGGATVIATDTAQPSATHGSETSVSKLWDLAVNDYVELCVQQDSGGALNLSTAELEMVRVA